MTLHTAFEGIVHGLRESLLDMQHSAFCLLAGLVIFTLRRRPQDAWFFIFTLFPGYILQRFMPLPPVLINVVVALTVAFALLQEWMYEKLAAYTVPFLILAGFFHGLSLSQDVSGSGTPAFLAFTLTATLMQGLLLYGFGIFARRVSLKSPESFEGLENIVSAVGTGVALTYFVLAF